jgi:hypothetical protein
MLKPPLENDNALVWWERNHIINKPQIILNEVGGVLPLDRAYGYSNGGWNVGGTLHKLVQLDPIIETVPLRGVTMTEEAMAFVSQSRSLPAGRTPTNLGFSGGGSMTWICAILETSTALYGYGRFNARLAFGVIYFTHSTSAPIHSHEE